MKSINELRRDIENEKDNIVKNFLDDLTAQIKEFEILGKTEFELKIRFMPVLYKESILNEIQTAGYTISRYVSEDGLLLAKYVGSYRITWESE